MVIWLQFIACTVVILYAGTRLSKYGDIIAGKTGLGRFILSGLGLLALGPRWLVDQEPGGSSSRALASRKSTVSNPSVNQS
ncbi:MAG: hypothetical protein ACKV2V_21535 [Blastocatellia bacterium]